MKYAVIDIGSNTIRLCVYQAEGEAFHLLFSEKVMAGLAGYVRNGALSPAGIRQAAAALTKFRELLAQFEIGHTFVFATASLRNITNTEEAVQQISVQTGFSIDLLSGEEEAVLDYRGSLHAQDLPSGLLIDIGGGSTELVVFEQGAIRLAKSLPVGSLSLHTQYVKKFLPRAEEQEQIRKRIRQEFGRFKKTSEHPAPDSACGQGLSSFRPDYPEICGVGGTARAALKLINAEYRLPHDNRQFSAGQLHALTETLCLRNKEARTRILRACPDRVHTIIPGLLILDALVRQCGGRRVTVSRFGVREGYLCKQLERLRENQ